jgi:hypothetical protein
MHESHFHPVDEHNQHVDRTCAKLLIYPGSMHPNEITAMLGIQPTDVVAIGEQKIPNSHGKAVVGKINGWFLSSEEAVTSRDLRPHLDWPVETLQPSRSVLHDLQTIKGVKMYVHCPWWSRTALAHPHSRRNKCVHWRN